MAQRRHHYERAFEEYLRTRRIPYVAVDEARKALLPDSAPLRMNYAEPVGDLSSDEGPQESVALKSFDFVIYGWDWTGKGQGESNLLLDVKGRRVVAARRRVAVGAGAPGAEFEEMGEPDDEPARRVRGGAAGIGGGAAGGGSGGASGGVGRLESWVTEDDVESLTRWGSLFGAGFDPAFVFVYWCDDQPPDALFQEVFEFQGRWYALRAVRLSDYVQAMKPRSLRWRTVHVPTGAFERISRPFARRPVPGRE